MFSSRVISSSLWVTVLLSLASSSLSGVLFSLILLARGTLSELEGFFMFIASISTSYSFLMIALWLKQRKKYSYKLIDAKTDLTCPVCNFEIEYGEPYCEVCGTSLYYCELCHGLLTKEDKVVITPCCGTLYHFDHLQSYLLKNGECPHCKSDLMLKIAEW